MNDDNKPQPRRHAMTHDKQGASVPHFCSEALFAGSKMIVIEHADRKYQLRLTSGNKLILTA